MAGDSADLKYEQFSPPLILAKSDKKDKENMVKM